MPQANQRKSSKFKNSPEIENEFGVAPFRLVDGNDSLYLIGIIPSDAAFAHWFSSFLIRPIWRSKSVFSNWRPWEPPWFSLVELEPIWTSIFGILIDGKVVKLGFDEDWFDLIVKK